MYNTKLIKCNVIAAEKHCIANEDTNIDFSYIINGTIVAVTVGAVVGENSTGHVKCAEVLPRTRIRVKSEVTQKVYIELNIFYID